MITTNLHLNKLGARLLWRDLRSGHITILLIALLVAVATHNTIGFITERINSAMAVQSATLLGGDLVVRSPTVTPSFRAVPESVTVAEVVEFPSVVMAKDAMQLSSIKAVSAAYPLRSNLRIANEPYGAETTRASGPSRGEVWLEARLLSQLGVAVGDSVDVGSITLKVGAILTYEPDLGDGFYSFVPRLIMNLKDLAAAELIQEGSKVDYFYQYSGPQEAISTLQSSLETQLKPGQSILSMQSRSRSIQSALSRAQGYLQLASLVAVLLAAVALAMGARYFSESRFDTAALLRSFGLQSNQVLALFVSQLVILAFVSSILGGALGWALHFIAISLLGNLLPDAIPLPSLTPVWSGFGLAFLILMGFSLPALLQLQRTPPLRVLRKNLVPTPASISLVYAVVGFTVGMLMWFYVQDLSLIAGVIIGTLFAWIFAFGLGYFFNKVLEKLSRFCPLPVQAGLRQLMRRRFSTRVQILGFGLTGMAMLLVFLVRGELLGTWQKQLPEQAPNYFAMNILPEVKQPFAAAIVQQGLVAQPLYPMIPGRLTHINNVPVREAVSKEQEAPEALNRELNLSWSETLPSDNRIIEGQWWDQLPQSVDSKQVSVEQRLAAKLGIKLGDTMSFFVADKTFSAVVTSIRSVNWESFQPNFYLLFSPENLAGLPHTFLTSFYVQASQKDQLQALSRQFPAVTLLSVDAILAQVRQILRQVSTAVEFILIFVLAAGLCITFATLLTTMPQRLREGAIMRALGATKRQLIQQQWTEFFTIGLMAGIVACAGTELIRLIIFVKFFNSPYTPSLWIWIMVPPFLGLLVGCTGQFSSRRIIKQSPMAALREL